MGGRTSLWKVLQNNSSTITRTIQEEHSLVELLYVVLKRVTFLSEYARVKQSKIYEFLFTDEIWMFKGETVTCSRQNRKTKEVSYPHLFFYW